MDYFSHAIWSYIFFNKTKKPLYAVLFGILPDSISWLLYFFYRLFTAKVNYGPPVLENFPPWIMPLYGISHSLIICAAVFLIVYLVYKNIPIYMFAWPIHILIDIPTHTREVLPTPFLWPISNWAFPGMSWATGWFFILNWSLIIVIIIVIVFKKKGWYPKWALKK